MWKHSNKVKPSRTETRPISVHQAYQTQTFDVESGQVYTESHARVGSRHHSDWIGELKTPSLVKPVPLNPEGARSLLQMARTCVIKQVRSLNYDHLSMIPWSIAQDIWEEILASRRESFHAWRIFAQCYSAPSEFASPRYRYHIRIRQPSLGLEDYLRPITSEDVSWLTCLRISPKETRTASLVGLARISNLAVLDLSDGQVAIDIKESSFDERVLRAWAELAETEGRLKHLRVIMLGWQEHVLPTWLFKYLGSFPLLRHVIITDCPKMHQKNRKDWEPQALDQGWMARHAKRSAKSLRPVLNEQGFHFGAVSGLLFPDGQADEEMKSADPIEFEVPRPVLECVLGTPKVWSHIVEDFPSTRTIFFDRVKPQKSRTKDTPVSASIDAIKRARNSEQRSLEVRSPPPKRATKPGVKMRPGYKGASDILSEWGNK